MASSLARQLAALRTPATQAITTDTAYSGPFLFDEADQNNCDFATLKENTKQALDQLLDKEIAFARYYSFLLEDRPDDRLESEIVEELLFLLSPYTLLKPAQWVLQHLVINVKVHYKYPELFFFCVLPFYEYDIYNRALQAIDTTQGGTEYPNWLRKFKESSFPTTKLNLYRHTASDKGFLKLLTDMMLKMIRILVTFPEMRIQRQTSMFVMTILGGLQNRDKVTEEQTLYILQVIFKGMKSNQADLVAMSQILLSYILPLVNFKQKVVAKILKTIKKRVKRQADMESMMLVMLLVRTQENVNHQDVWSIFVSMEAVINQALNLAEDPEMAQNLDDIVYTMAVLLKPVLPADHKSASLSSCPPMACQLVNFCGQIMKKVRVSEETCCLLGELASAFVRCIGNTSNEEVVDSGSLEKLKCHCEVIIKQINIQHPDVYQQVMTDTKDIDLFFLGNSVPGGMTNNPDQVLVNAKKIILNNNLVGLLKNQLVSPGLRNNRRAQKSWKKNKNDFTTLLSVETAFLMEHLPGDSFQHLLFNSMLFLKKEAWLAMKHLCEKKAWSDDMISMEVDAEATVSRVDQFRLEMLALPIFFQVDKSEIRDSLVSSFFGKKSALISCLSSISTDHPDKRGAVLEKLKMLINTDMVNSFIKDNFIWENTDIASLILQALKEKMTTNSSVITNMSDFVSFLIKVIENSVLSLSKVQKVPGKDENKTEEVETADDKMINTCFELLRLIDLTSGELGILFLDKLPQLVESGGLKTVVNLEKIIESKLKDELEILSFYLDVAARTESAKTKYLVLSRLLHILENQNFVDKLLAADNNIFPQLLSLILSENESVRKLGFSFAKKLKKQCDESCKYSSIIQFLVVNKSELIVDVSSNLSRLLEKANLPEEVLHALLVSTTKCNPAVFETLIPFFIPLKSSESVEALASFATQLVKSGERDSALAVIIKKFYKRLVKQVGQPSCYSWLMSVISCSRVITVAGLNLRISELFLDRASGLSKIWSDHDEATIQKIFQDILEITTEAANVKMIPMMAAMPITVEMFRSQLINIWGEQSLKSKERGRSNFSDEGAGLDQEELKIWSKTVFVLELLESYVPREEKADGWEILVPTVFAVFRKLSNDDVLESSYKLNLILSVLLKLFTRLHDDKIRSLQKGDLEAELLTYCIRRSSNPESRQLGLKVLAKCALSIPEYVLQNSMTIFTFMGTHLLKMDSKHSYQIACEAIDVIIPAMKSTCTNKQDLQKISLEILNNFIHMDEDVPEHRYSEFVYRLIMALDSETYLWIAMLLCIKSTFKSKQRVKRTNLIHRRIIELIDRFSVNDVLRGFIGILVNLRTDLPQVRKIFGCPLDRKEDQERADEWDVLRLGGLHLLAKLLSSPTLISRVGTHLIQQEHHEAIKDLLHLLLESSILTLEAFSSLPDSIPEKLRSSIREQGEHCLQLVLSLLPYKLYINIVGELVASSNSTLRRRAMEVVSSKLESVEEGTDVSADVANLLPALLDLALKETSAANQQMAFLSLRQMSRKVKDKKLLVEALKKLSPQLLASISNPGVLGAAILTVTDVIMCAGVHGVQHLDGVVKWMLKALNNVKSQKWEEKYEKVVYTSLLLGIQKIVEKFGGFLNPYLDSIVLTACRLHDHVLAGGRARELWNSLAQHLEPHVLLPRAKELLETAWQEASTVAKLSGLVGLNSKKLERGELKSMDKAIISLFNKALTFRKDHKLHEQVETTESEIIDAFLTVGLKMCLDDFKPVFNKIAEKLKTGDDACLTTLFNFTQKIAASLKNLFGFGLEFVLVESTRVLNLQEASQSCILAVLRCLSGVMLYNKISDLTQDVYENLVSAVLPLYQKSASLHQAIEDALLALADATENDVYWKHLNFCVLMELRNSDPEVRLRILRLVKRFVTSRKDTYMVVLPDAVPFLTEALEDDEQEVETECKDLIQHMETVFGQNIEAYFT